MSNVPWFRLYSEVLSDRKIARICRETSLPKVVVIGFWTVVLAIANDSPKRGHLLISDGLPITTEELADEIGLEIQETSTLIEKFTQLNMLCLDGQCLIVTHWDNRQFPSDSSTERTKRYRERQANNSETSQERHGDGLEAEADSEADNSSSASPSAAATKEQVSEKLTNFYLACKDAKPNLAADYIEDFLSTYPPWDIEYALTEGVKNNAYSLAYIEKICKRRKSGEPDKPPTVNGAPNGTKRTNRSKSTTFRAESEGAPAVAGVLNQDYLAKRRI